MVHSWRVSASCPTRRGRSEGPDGKWIRKEVGATAIRNGNDAAAPDAKLRQRNGALAYCNRKMRAVPAERMPNVFDRSRRWEMWPHMNRRRFDGAPIFSTIGMVKVNAKVKLSYFT